MEGDYVSKKEHVKAFTAFVDLNSYCQKHQDKGCSGCIFDMSKGVVRDCVIENLARTSKRGRKDFVGKVITKLNKLLKR